MDDEATSDVLRLRPEAVSWREVDGEIVALDLRSGDYLAVNATGATLWSLLDDGATQQQLSHRLADKFELEQPRAEQDVRAFVADLDARNLLVRSTAQ